MNALFDSAALAIVAYAEVDSSGTSTVTNSGVTTTKTTTGVYHVILSPERAQDPSRDLIVVTPLTTAVSISAGVYNVSNQTKAVQFSNAGGTLTDCAFSVVILRTVIPA